MPEPIAADGLAVLVAAGEDGSAWEFGWEAVVAIATGGLAAVTAWLAWTTRRLARATSDEVAAQWRPVILPAAAPTGYDGSSSTYTVQVRNAGVGPALAVSAILDPDHHRPNRRIEPLAPGDKTILAWDGMSAEWLRDPKRLRIDYRDVAGRTFASVFDLEPGDPAVRQTHEIKEVSLL